MYKLFQYDGIVIGAYKEEDGIRTSFCFNDPANTDYQAYLAWLEEGNEPEAAE